MVDGVFSDLRTDWQYNPVTWLLGNLVRIQEAFNLDGEAGEQELEH